MDLYKDFDTCLGNVLDSIKTILYTRHSDIFERLNFDDDNIYQEPLLYTYLNQNDNKWLDCIIYGYEKETKLSIEVFSNSEGVIYLPKIGYLITSKLSETLILETRNNEMKLFLKGEQVDFAIEPILLLKSGVELMKYQHPLLETVFAEVNSSNSEVVIKDVYKIHLDHINKGLEIIQECNPDHFKLLQKNLKRIMVFTANEPNSFAVLTAHNMIFLNVNPWDNEMFFADHISHEGGHVTFNTLTYESKYNLFNCNPHTKLADITGLSWEHSTVYLRFHGLYSYLQISQCLYSCINNEKLSKQNIHEAKGRFVFHVLRYKMSLDVFENINIFRPEGLEWFNIFKEHYLKIEKQYELLHPYYNLYEQPYDFNTMLFEEQNSLH